MENWDKALSFVRRECKKARKLGWGGAHPSFSVSEILAKAEAKFGLPSFGVVGWCDAVGKNCVSYLNMGDPYELTIYVRTTPHSARVSLGCWGDLV